MELGAFSISLTVKDIEASRIFYEKFGFEVIGGDAARHFMAAATIRRASEEYDCRGATGRAA